MLHKFGVMFVVCACMAIVSSGVEPAQAVHWNYFGAVRVGMTLAQLNRALQTSYERPSDSDERACFYVDMPKAPGIAIMILDGRVARIDVDSATIPTAQGIKNGDSEARAIQKYGKRLRIQPHCYSPETGHYLTLYSRDRKSGIRFETEDGKITRYYAGTASAILFIEGCS